MSGLKSRRKGMRVEYLIRDAFREKGFVVDRVPASGASQGFKGDLRIRYNSQDTLVEVKARKTGWAQIYKLFGDEELTSIYIDNDIIITTDPGAAFYGTLTERYGYYFSKFNPWMRGVFHNLFLLRGNCDILVLKADNKPPLYIKWVNEQNYTSKEGVA